MRATPEPKSRMMRSPAARSASMAWSRSRVACSSALRAGTSPRAGSVSWWSSSASRARARASRRPSASPRCRSASTRASKARRSASACCTARRSIVTSRSSRRDCRKLHPSSADATTTTTARVRRKLRLL